MAGCRQLLSGIPKGRFPMNQFEMTPAAAFETSTVASAERVTTFLRAVYGWMCVGLGITAAVAFAVVNSPGTLQTIAANPILRWGVILVPLGLVFFLAARVQKMAPGTAAAVFSIYSALNGVMFAFILAAYTGTSVATTFVVTAGMFGALALFGTTTKRSLAGVGQFAFMGLVGLILASIVGFFWHSSALQFVISVVGVIVFTGLTAWDAQRLKVMAAAVPEGRFGSYAVVGALSLYLDFINLFLFLLRFLGGRRD
jgi:FtsH-binding integral membrane protein